MPSHRRPRVLVLSGLALSAAALSSPALAAETALGHFDITAGIGAAMRPTYLGSDRYRVSPLPLVSLKWNDMVSAGPEGLRLYWHSGALTAGAGLTFDGGRDEKNPNTLGFGNGDERLKGMGKIDAAIGYQGFINYRLGMVDLSTSVTKYDGSQNDGLLLRFGAAVPVKLTSRLVITPHGETQWANDSYMQTFFGVSAGQALHSQFARFTAGSGLFGVTGGIRANYAITQHWFATGDVATTLLTGDAKNSPLSYSDTATTVVTAIGYRF